MVDRFKSQADLIYYEEGRESSKLLPGILTAWLTKYRSNDRLIINKVMKREKATRTDYEYLSIVLEHTLNT